MAEIERQADRLFGHSVGEIKGQGGVVRHRRRGDGEMPQGQKTPDHEQDQQSAKQRANPKDEFTDEPDDSHIALGSSLV